MQTKANTKSDQKAARFAVKPQFFQVQDRQDKAPTRVMFEVGTKLAMITRDDKADRWLTVCPISNVWTGKCFTKLKDAMTHVADFYSCLNNTLVQSQILEPKRITTI